MGMGIRTASYAVVGMMFAASVTFASAEVDSLRHKQFGREAASKKFLAKLEHGHAKLALQTAKSNYSRVYRLAGSAAASWLELSYSTATLLQREFEVAHAAYKMKEAATLEESWKLQAGWAAAR